MEAGVLEQILEQIERTNSLISGQNFFFGMILGSMLFLLFVRKW